MKKLKYFKIAVIFLVFQACQKQGSQSDQSSLAGSAAAGILADVQLTTPDSNRGKITLDVKTIDQLKSITMTIDDVDAGKITKLPYEVYFDGTVNTKPEVVVKAIAINMAGEQEVVQKTIVNVSSTEPGSDPTTDPECFSNPAYDACLFYKNPVAQNKAALPSKVSYGADLSAVQVFGVKLRNLTNPNQLKNNSLNVTSSAGVRAVPVNGQWNFAYRTDTTKHQVAQVMAFYWLNEQIEYMKTNSGVFYAENKNIPVDAFTTSVQNNAYWDGTGIVMGNFGTQELALSSEVYLHEMGHGNLDYATNNQLNIGSGFCPTKFGCIGAIHEGMADIHMAIMFPLDPTLSQTVTNTLAGWTNRDPRSYVNKTLDFFFSTLAANGEVHAMGTAYATILWEIHSDPLMNPRDFETMFSLHLPRLTSSSDFRSAKSIWINLSDTRYAGKYSAMIKGYFERMGVL